MLRCLAAVTIAMLIASGAHARGYNCGVREDLPEGRWDLDEALAKQVVGDIAAQGLGAPFQYRYRFCGSIENGQQMIMIGMIAQKDSRPVCDAPENFAVFYDPKARTFGKPIAGATFCFPPPPPSK